MQLLKKYLIFFIASLIIAGTYLWNEAIGMKAVLTVANSLKEMLFILPPIFILLGLLDVWVPRETMVKFMGKGSGIPGTLLAFLLGSAAAGPLYVVFPVAAAFMRKDVGFFNILILVGAWSTTKIPMLLFEYSSMGPRFTLTRLALNIPLILLIALTMTFILKQEDIQNIYARAKEME